MPIINRVQGNLLTLFADGEFDAIAHGCNCFNTMGAGIALQIAREYPEAHEADWVHHTPGEDVLGLHSHVDTRHGRVFNLYTQFRPGRQPGVEKLVKSAFKLLDKLYSKRKLHIGIPLIGAGLAGGNWRIIEQGINEVTPHLNITLVEYKP